MALKLTKPTPRLDAGYYRVTGVSLDADGPRARVSLSRYTSKAHRDTDGAVPVSQHELVATGDEYAKHFGPLAKKNAWAAAYAYAKGAQSVTPTTPRVAVPDDSPRERSSIIPGVDEDGPRTVLVPDTASPFADAADA